jgi:hypothetical protein
MVSGAEPTPVVWFVVNQALSLLEVHEQPASVAIWIVKLPPE